MREKEESFVLVTRERKLHQRFTLGVSRTFDQDCSSNNNNNNNNSIIVIYSRNNNSSIVHAEFV